MIITFLISSLIIVEFIIVFSFCLKCFEFLLSASSNLLSQLFYFVLCCMPFLVFRVHGISKNFVSL